MCFKKFIIPLLILLFTVIIMYSSVFASPNATLSVFDSYGEELTNVCDIKSAQLTLTLKESFSENANVLFASYNNDIIYDISIQPLKQNETIAEAALKFPGTQTQYAKAFIWNNKMEPLTKTIPISEKTEMHYGFVLSSASYYPTGVPLINLSYETRILDETGTVKTYDLAENVLITDTNTSTMSDTDVYNTYISKMPLFLSGYGGNSNYTVWRLKSNTTYEDVYGNTIATDLQKAENYAQRIIAFSVNSEEKISQIIFPGENSDNKEFSKITDPTIATYDKFEKSFADLYEITENTIIFNLPVFAQPELDDFQIIQPDLLCDNCNYTLSVFDAGKSKLMILTDRIPSQNLAVVSKVITTNNSAGERIYAVTFTQNGEEKTLATTNDVFNSVTFAKGDVFEYSIDNDGAIVKVAFDGTDFDTLGITEIADKNYPAIFTENDSDKIQYVFGAVYDKYNSSRTINLVSYADDGTAVNANNTANIGRHFIPAEAQVVVIDCTKSNTATNKVVVGSFGDIQSSRWINGQVDEDSDYAVLRYYKETVTDVIVYKHYVNKVYYGN